MSQIELNISLTLPSTSLCSNQFSPSLTIAPVLVKDTTIYQVVWARIMPRRLSVPFSLCVHPHTHAQYWWFYSYDALLNSDLFLHPHCQNCNSKLHYFLPSLLQKPPLTISFKSLLLVLPHQSKCLTLEQLRAQSIDHVSIYSSSLVISSSHIMFNIIYVPSTSQILASEAHIP